MFGDICPTCHQEETSCGCNPAPCGCDDKPNPCLPCNESECPDIIGLECTLWLSSAVAGTPIVKGMKGTELILYLLNRIKTLEDRLTQAGI
jgi:hypothetical protein